LMSLIVRYGSNLLVAKMPAIPPFDIFKSDIAGAR
jgi:hypothetical protein